MGGTYVFSAPIEQADGGGAYVTIPFDVEAAFGKKRVPVNATIDGIEYRGSLVRMGGDCHVLGILKAVREELGKQAGAVVEISLEHDVAPRTVEVPPELREALARVPGAAEAFEALSYSHQREYVNWIGEAKREETRHRRVLRTAEALGRGERPR